MHACTLLKKQVHAWKKSLLPKSHFKLKKDEIKKEEINKRKTTIINRIDKYQVDLLQNSLKYKKNLSDIFSKYLLKIKNLSDDADFHLEDLENIQLELYELKKTFYLNKYFLFDENTDLKLNFGQLVILDGYFTEFDIEKYW